MAGLDLEPSPFRLGDVSLWGIPSPGAAFQAWAPPGENARRWDGWVGSGLAGALRPDSPDPPEWWSSSPCVSL